MTRQGYSIRIITMKKTLHIVKEVKKNSLAYYENILSGDVLISVNGEEIEDIFDYQYLTEDSEVTLVLKRESTEYSVHISKDPDEDIGLVFDSGLMDEYRSCTNKCIFCFIDQMPPGMRETLYFKDDDSRLSFLQGNYVTLTNMSAKDIERICKYHLSPINISFQTTNPELRCKMLNNRFAGDALKKVDILNDADITMNGQIVLCKGVNDGDELERSIRDLTKYLPNLQSVSVVPVGLSKYREGLYPLEPFTPEDSAQVIDIIERWQKRIYPEYGFHFIHASDEWYINAKRQLPEEERYDGYLQLENGVGMVRLLLNEVEDALSETDYIFKPKEELSIATGRLIYPCICEIAEQIMRKFPGLVIHVYEIVNEFFGEMITVSGLITGSDLGKQLKGKNLGKRLLLPENMLRAGEDYFLDDITIPELSQTLQVSIDIVKSSGYDLVKELTKSGKIRRKVKV